jgi:hypothetical protein
MYPMAKLKRKTQNSFTSPTPIPVNPKRIPVQTIEISMVHFLNLKVEMVFPMRRVVGGGSIHPICLTLGTIQCNNLYILFPRVIATVNQ